MRRALHIRVLSVAAAFVVLGQTGLRGQQRFVGGATRGSGNATSLGEAHFEIDTETRSLIVTADAETNEQIRSIIESLDQPVPQVLIKVLFIEVTHDDGADFGTDINYTREASDGDRTVLSSLFGVIGDGRGAVATILENDLEITMRALAEVGKLEVLSRPSIMARNNEEATITVGQEVPFVRNSRVLENGETINTVEYEDIGIILTVTPQIASTGLVELAVAPEISTLTGETIAISNTVDAPVFAKRSAETHVVVPSGKTVVIGGLMEDQETETVRKVPILGDIWLIGNFFKRTIRDKSKTELLIFLTPTVVNTSTGIAQTTDAARAHAELIPKAFSPEQLNRYIPAMQNREQDNAQ